MCLDAINYIPKIAFSDQLHAGINFRALGALFRAPGPKRAFLNSFFELTKNWPLSVYFTQDQFCSVYKMASEL